jgi:nitrate reductase (cytochrome), electron transfer subunit
MKNLIMVIISLSLLILSFTLTAQAEEIATLRDGTAISEQKKPNAIPKIVNTDILHARNYPMQPPLIPHKVRDYQIDLEANKCLSCHSRIRTEDSQAPMVSVTHFMDRDGNFLAEVSPRRYFCNQCHIPQADIKALVGNTFKDMHTLMKEKVNDKKVH